MSSFPFTRTYRPRDAIILCPADGKKWPFRSWRSEFVRMPRKQGRRILIKNKRRNMQANTKSTNNNSRKRRNSENTTFRKSNHEATHSFVAATPTTYPWRVRSNKPDLFSCQTHHSLPMDCRNRENVSSFMILSNEGAGANGNRPLLGPCLLPAWSYSPCCLTRVGKNTEGGVGAAHRHHETNEGRKGDKLDLLKHTHTYTQASTILWNDRKHPAKQRGVVITT